MKYVWLILSVIIFLPLVSSAAIPISSPAPITPQEVSKDEQQVKKKAPKYYHLLNAYL